MKIGIDATCWGNKRGFGRFTRELLEALLKLDETNEYLFFTDSSSEKLDSIPARVKKIVVQTEISPIQAASSEGRRSLKDLWAMSREVWRHKLDIFFFPTVYSYFPVFNSAKIIVTIHDMIADNHPELIFPNSKLKFFWKLKQNTAVRQADLIATVSEYSKNQIKEFFNLSESRFRIITEAARPIFKVLPKDEESSNALKRHKLNADEKFLLYVGGISPHKNLNTLIDAFNRIVKDEKHSQTKLVLVGDYKDDPFLSAYPSLKKQSAKLNLKEKIIFSGFVPDEDLAHLYNAAQLLVFPSLEEGFGLPAIEAMSCGTPVAASNCGSLPEVLGNAGRFFNPKDSQNIAEVLSEVLANNELKNSMRNIGLERSQQFKWEKAAQETLAIFNYLAGKQAMRKNVSPNILIDSKNL